jgi:hypothetical protein
VVVIHRNDAVPVSPLSYRETFPCYYDEDDITQPKLRVSKSVDLEIPSTLRSRCLAAEGLDPGLSEYPQHALVTGEGC